MAVEFVRVRINPQTRPSRLMKSIPHYIKNSSVTIVRAYTMYRPLRVFTALGGLLILLGAIPGIRFLYFYFVADHKVGHVQSLILAAILLITGFQMLMIGVLADLLNFSRKIQEELIFRVRRLEAHAGPSADRSTSPATPESPPDA